MEKICSCSHKESYLHLNPGSASSTLAEKQTNVLVKKNSAAAAAIITIIIQITAIQFLFIYTLNSTAGGQLTVSMNTYGSRLDPAALSSMLLAARCTTVSPVATGSDSHLLLPPPTHASLLHDPYTPESMETPSSSPTPSMIPQFVFPDEYERKSDANLTLYESPQSTEDKIHSWNFVANTLERPDSPDEECGGDRTECNDGIRKITRPGIQEMHEYYSGPQNDSTLLTEKFPSGSYRRIVFTSSGMEDVPEESSNKNTDCPYNAFLSSEDEAHKQELIASNLNSTIQFQVPDIIEDKCESCSSLNECSSPCNMSEMEIESKKIPVAKRCFCARDVHNKDNNNAEHRHANRLTLNCAAGTIQNSSQVENSNKSVQSISGFPSETQDGDNGVDAQVLRSDIPVFLLKGETKSDLRVDVAQTALLCSAVSNPGAINVQSALNIESHTDRTPPDIESHTDRTPPDISQERQSCSFQCDDSALSGHSLSYKMANPDSNSAVITDVQTAIECRFTTSDSSSKMGSILPTKNSFLSSKCISSVESRELNVCKNRREQPLRQTSEGTMLPCKKVFELSTRLLNNAIFKLRRNTITAHDCPVKNLFRSASAPINFCSTRTQEKKIPYLLFISHSCGDICTTYRIQDLGVYPENCGEKSALKQESYAEQSSSTSSVHGSVIETPVKYKRKKKRDRKSSDRKCFSCLLL
jgi:hypothetical protein